MLGAAQSGTTTIRGIQSEVDVSFSDIWSNLEIGAMFNFRAQSERWMARLRADVGGFGVGSDFAYQLVALLGWDFADSWSLAFGYRYLDMEYETGSGSELFRYDVATSGPEMGVSFRF